MLMASKSSNCRSMLVKMLLALIFFLSIWLQGSDAQFEDYCIADDQASEDELVNAMRWACSNGADCSAIQDYQNCYFPNTTKNHATYAFNSYYQNMKHNGASCYFTAAAILTGLDPSHDSCKFVYIP